MASSSQPTAQAPPSSPSKRLKLSLQGVVENDGVDRISDLPDSLLCHILSFLPTRKAVVTSILSSRWKTLWTFVPCLHLDYNLIVPSSSSLRKQWNQCISLPDIVSRVFAQHKAPYLGKFILDATFEEFHCFHVDTWVRASISSKLEELDLSIYYNSDSDEPGEMFELPRSIFSCKNLVVLKLTGEILLNLPSSFNLPSLKFLHLKITPCTEYPDWRLLSGCPVLEDLVLDRVGTFLELEDYGKLEICVPTLKSLRISFIDDQGPDYKLEIYTPALEYFTFISALREVVFLENTPNLVAAYLDIQEDYVYADKVLGLLRQLYNVELLSLSLFTTDCFRFLYVCDLPMFHNLAWLKYKFCCCNWPMLPYLLDQAPNLAEVVVDEAYSNVCQKHHMNVPRDLSPHLTTFYLRGFRGLKDEMEFVRCILLKAKGLKTMTFGLGIDYEDKYKNAEEKSRILKEISSFRRWSKSCRFAFE